MIAHYYTYPSNLSQVTLDLVDVSDFSLLEVAIGTDNYGYVVAQKEIPSARVKKQIDGQTRNHTYWGQISFVQTIPVKVLGQATPLTKPVVYRRELNIHNTTNWPVMIGDYELMPNYQLAKVIEALETVYCYMRPAPAELTATLTVI